MSCVVSQSNNSQLYLFSVPYDSSKPFVWVDYLCASNSKPVPVSVFQQVRSSVMFTQIAN